MAAKKTAYNRAFGGGTDNLWETVDTIMVDLLHQAGDGTSITETDVDAIKSTSTTRKKEKELDEMMENLDTLLDDLQDISSISNDTTTPPRSINSSAEKIKPKRATNEEFLEIENPLDSITQGLLYQTADVPLFASSEVPPPGSPQSQPQQLNVEDDYNEEESEEEEDWGEDTNTAGQAKEQNESTSNHESTSNRESGEIEELQLPLEEELPENTSQQDTPQDSNSGNEALTSRLYAAAAKAEEIRRLVVKDRISKYQELSKITASQHQSTNKPAASFRPTKSSLHHSAKAPVVHHKVALPANSYRSRPFSTLTVERPTRALPPPPNANPLHSPSSQSATSPTATPDNISLSPTPSISPSSASISLTSAPTAPGSPRMLPPLPTQGPPRPPRPNAPGKSPQLQRKDGPDIQSPTESKFASDGTQVDNDNSQLTNILTKSPPPLPSVPSPRHKNATKRATFTPSVRSSDHPARSQINIGTRKSRSSAEGNSPPSTNPSSPTSDNSVLATSPIPIPTSSSNAGFASSTSSTSSSSTSPTPLDLNSDSPFETPPSTDTVFQREANIRRVISSPVLREPEPNPSLHRIASQNAIQKKTTTTPQISASPSTSPPALSINKPTKSLRLTPVGQHRTPTRLLFGGDGISVQIQPNGQTPTSPLSQSSTPTQENFPNSASHDNDTQGITVRHGVPLEVKERNAKIKQLRDLMRRYRTKLMQMENKHSREAQDLSARINTGTKDAQIQLRSCVSWGQHVLTSACRKNWQLKIFVLKYRCELHSMQASLLQAKLELVEQLMTLLEIEYKNTGSSAAKNDFVIYSSFFKDPSEVMTSPEVERMLRLLPKLMRVKRRAKMEFQRLRAAYQPELPERRMRRIKDILVRMYPSPLLPNYYAPDDVLQADFDSVATDQRLLEGRHIQHLKNFLQEDLAGDRSITPGEICDFLQQFAQKMSEMFGVNAQDASKLLLLSKRAIYPRIYHLLVPTIPASVSEQDQLLSGQLTWLHQLDPVVLREGLKLDNRPFQGPNATTVFESAIEALNELSFLIVPTDMSVAVHRAFKLTHDITLAQLRTHGGGNTEMGMDDVFPMFLWVVTQCNVACLCQCVYFMEFFSDNEERISILGYSATSLAAAVAHLSQIEKELFIN